MLWIVNDITEHNHIPHPIREEVLSVVNENKRLALETNDDPKSIIKNSQTCLSNEASANMVRHSNLRQTIHRIRNKKAGHGVNSKTREEIKIDMELKKTLNNENFLINDSGELEVDRVILFGTENNIELLSKTKAQNYLNSYTQ